MQKWKDEWQASSLWYRGNKRYYIHGRDLEGAIRVFGITHSKILFAMKLLSLREKSKKVILGRKRG